MTELCCGCHQKPRKPKQAYCAECSRTYQREWARRKRGQKPRPVKPTLNDEEKFCFKCGRILPRQHFHRSVSKKDGLMSCCKDCDRLKGQAWRDRNRRYIRKRDRLVSQAWRDAHPDYNRKYLARRKRLRIARRIERAMEGGR